MTDEKLEQAIQILGRKVVLSLKRMSLKNLGDFDESVEKLLEIKTESV